MTNKSIITKEGQKVKIILNGNELDLTDDQVKDIVKQYKPEKVEKIVGFAIKSRWVSAAIVYQSTKSNIREAVLEAYLSNADLRGADLSNANLRDANLSNANLSDAELQRAKFYGRGGDKPLKREQLPAFLLALGFIIED